MFVDAEGEYLINGRVASFAVSMPNRASSLRPPSPKHPTSPPRLSSRRPTTASLATIPGSVYTNHPQPDSPLQLGITLCLSPLAALRSKGSLSCFPLTSPIPKTPHHCNTHHITMGSIGEEPAKCPMRVANTASGGTKVLHVLLLDCLYSMLTRHPEP